MDTDQGYPDLYSEPYYDNNDTTNDTIIRDYGSMSTGCRGLFALLLRAGFLLIQLGCIPISSVYLIIIQNIVDIAVATVVYGLLGYMLAFGYDYLGLVGARMWLMSDEANMDDAILGWSAVIVATGIYTAMFAGRMHLVAYTLVTTVSAAVLIPILMHWVWSSGWMVKSTLLSNHVTYKDHGGGMIIHVYGGTVAIIGCFYLGRRLLRLSDIDESSLAPDAPGTTILGYFLVMLGLITIGLPTPRYELTHMPFNYIGIVIMNNILAAGGGMLLTVISQLIMFHFHFDYWIVIRGMQGGLAGIVTIASGVDVYKPLIALGLGVAGAFVYFCISYKIFHSSLEDYASIIGIHLLCGFFGTLLPPLCGTSEGFGVVKNMGIHFAWQVACSFFIFFVVFIIMAIIFLLLCLCGILRNAAEKRDYQRALTVAESRPPRRYWRRIFHADSESLLLHPGYRTRNEKQVTNVEVVDREDEDTPRSETQHLPQGKTVLLTLLTNVTPKDSEKLHIEEEGAITEIRSNQEAAEKEKEQAMIKELVGDHFDIQTETITNNYNILVNSSGSISKNKTEGSGDHFNTAQDPRPESDEREPQASALFTEAFFQGHSLIHPQKEQEDIINSDISHLYNRERAAEKPQPSSKRSRSISESGRTPQPKRFASCIKFKRRPRVLCYQRNVIRLRKSASLSTRFACKSWSHPLVLSKRPVAKIINIV